MCKLNQQYFTYAAIVNIISATVQICDSSDNNKTCTDFHPGCFNVAEISTKQI